MRSKPILLVGFGNEASGFGRVTNSIARALLDRHEVVQFALDLAVAPTTADRAWPLLVNNARFDSLGLTGIADAIEHYRPDIVWILNDFWWLHRYADLIKRYKSLVKFVAYVPLDGEILRAGALTSLALFDAVAVYTVFARREIERAVSCPSWQGERPSIPEIRVIPHGVDLAKFYPIEDGDADAGPATAGKMRMPARDSFLVLNGNQNNARKRIDLTLKGFAKFARKKPPGVKLVLNCSTSGTSRRAPGTDIFKLGRHLQILDRLVTNGSPNVHSRMSDADLNRLYNRCAVGLNTSWGEGWGLVSCEHGAAGGAQIVCRHTACREIWEGHAEMLETRANAMNSAAMLQGSVPSEDAVALSLERLYEDRELLRDLSSKAVTAIRQDRFTWNTIGHAWSAVFEDVRGV